jgi:riboflavin kinase / FMN adenylyltransferase
LSLEIIKGIDNYPAEETGVVATIGTFDGIHLGHQSILRQLTLSALRRRLKAVAITFEPHPRVLVTPDSPPPLLTDINEKARLLSDYLDGTLLVLEFNKKLMGMTAEEFTKNYLVDKIKINKLVVGYDHAFGKDRSGTINDLMGLSRKYSFDLQIVDPVIVDGRPISSTRIRHVIAESNLRPALELLGHAYPISGKVIQGIGLGAKIGFRTANLQFNPRKLLPEDGVYSCSVEYKSRNYRGMMFIGKNHFNPEAGKTVEVNIFDFNEHIYENEIFCFPEVFIRKGRKFGSTEELAKQLRDDKKRILMLKE